MSLVRVSGLGLVLVALVAVGCGGPATAPDAANTPAASKPRIALVMKSLANEFFQTMEQGARAHQQAHSGDYELLCNGIKDELDVNTQIKLVDQMVAQGVDAIVIAPADSKALVTACKKALDAGIVVVNIDNKFDDAVLADKGVKIPFIGPDNRKGAKAVAAYVAGKLQAGDPVAVIEGVPTAFNGVQRKLGFEDALNEAGLKIVSSQSGSWEMAKANDVVSAVMTEHPEVKAVLCANDSMALGAVAALKAANRPDVLVVGYDGIQAVRALVKEGQVAGTVEQHADQLAVFGIEYTLEMLKTKGAPVDRETPVDLVTAESLK